MDPTDAESYCEAEEEKEERKRERKIKSKKRRDQWARTRRIDTRRWKRRIVRAGVLEAVEAV